MLLMYRWHGTYIRFFGSQFIVSSLEEFHLLELSVSVTPFNVAFANVLYKHSLIVEISIGGMR